MGLISRPTGSYIRRSKIDIPDGPSVLPRTGIMRGRLGEDMITDDGIGVRVLFDTRHDLLATIRVLGPED